MKFVRWLGAFGRASSLDDSATWEQSQTDRQVAAEPLYRGKSLIQHAKIGLEIAHPEATFARGWLYDAYTVVHEPTGQIRATRNHTAGGEFRNMDKFLSAHAKKRVSYQGEAAFNAPLYCAVVVKKSASDRGKARAARLAAQMGLPLKTLGGC